MSSLSGKKAIVTGGAVGIGAGVARALAERGCDVAICDIQDDKAAATAASIAGDTGQACHHTSADVRNADAVKAFVDGAVEALGGLDIVVANAGVWRATNAKADSYDAAVADYGHVVDVNLRGAFLTGRAAIPHLVANGGGNLVHVATDHICPPPGTAPGGGTTMDLYDASKWALNGLTQSWARQLVDDGVRVNAVCMDATQSEMTENALRQLMGDEGFAELASSDMVGMWLQPENIGSVVVDLVEEGPEGRTGENVGIWIGHPLELQPAEGLAPARFP